MGSTRNVAYEDLISDAVGQKTILPKAPKVIFRPVKDDLKHLVLHLSDTAACENMQTTSAAFESWLIALKVWNVIETVRLEWDVPIGIKRPDVSWCHYQRFLYRVNYFNRLFGKDWFELDDSHKGRLVECDAIDETYIETKKLVLNVPDTDRHGDPESYKHEAWLEISFGTEGKDGHKLLANKFKLRSINRQLPVGLFIGKKSKESRIFTGGASAIDLVGIGDDDSLWIFELKKKGNHSLGIISELMFYSACMRDLRDCHFVLHDGKVGKRWSGDINDIAKNKPIHAVFLTPTVHPLFGGRQHETLDILNKACTKNGDAVEFHCQRFEYIESGEKPIGIKLID